MVRLRMEKRSCQCGAVSGRYLKNGSDARYSGPAISIGIDNYSLAEAIIHYGNTTDAIDFQACLASKDCTTLKKGRV